MHPEIAAELGRANQRELQRRARGARSRARPAEAAPRQDVSIRLATVAEAPALGALAALDGAPLPLGATLVAEVDGAPVAALPLAGGRAFADPFRRTAELRALLELRARQLSAPPRRRRLRGLAVLRLPRAV